MGVEVAVADGLHHAAGRFDVLGAATVGEGDGKVEAGVGLGETLGALEFGDHLGVEAAAFADDAQAHMLAVQFGHFGAEVVAQEGE